MRTRKAGTSSGTSPSAPQQVWTESPRPAPAAPPSEPRTGATRPGVGNRRVLSPADVAAKIQRRKRQQEAFLLRSRGLSITQIAAELKVSHAQARADVRVAAERQGQHALEQRRALLDAQYDEDIAMLNHQMTKLYEVPDAKWNQQVAIAIAAIARTKTRIGQARAQLLGLNAPVKVEARVQHEVSGAIGVVAAAMGDQRWAEMVERARERRKRLELPLKAG